MGGNNTIITISAMVLFGLLMLNTFNHILSSTDRTSEANYMFTAISIGQQKLKEITSKSFDEECISNSPEDSTEFSVALKYESGETYTTYDDVDDYNGYTETVTTEYTGDFTINSEVDYVKSSNPNIKSLIRTRTKRIMVSVYSTMLIDTIKLNYYSSY